MFKLVTWAQILVAQGSEGRDGKPKVVEEESKAGVGPGDYGEEQEAYNTNIWFTHSVPA